MKDLKEVLEKAKELTKDVVVDLDKPLEEDEPKYTIVYDEASCYNWGFSINGVWRSGEVEEGVKQPEEDDELLDYLLLKLKEGIKDGTCSFKDLVECFQSDDYESSDGYCDTCGHHGGRTTWRI
jgi:hypothetical protein